MADIPFRVVEKELKSNLTTRLKAIDYDARYYANDKDAPTEDVANTDWAPGGDPSVFTEPCV